MRKCHSSLLIAALIFTTVVTAVSSGFSEVKSVERRPAPSLGYRVGAHPYLGSDYEERPVVVSSVGSDAANGFKVVKVGLRNNSSKPVVAVRLGWYMSHDPSASGAVTGSRASVIVNGQTSRIILPGKIPVGQHGVVKQTLVSFEDAYRRSRQSQGEPSGRFRIEVAAVEVFFEDGSSWKDEQVYPTVGVLKLPTLKAAYLRPAPQYCPVTECSWNGGGYQCDGSNFQTACYNCTTACCNSLCSDPPVCNRCN